MGRSRWQAFQLSIRRTSSRDADSRPGSVDTSLRPLRRKVDPARLLRRLWCCWAPAPARRLAWRPRPRQHHRAGCGKRSRRGPPGRRRATTSRQTRCTRIDDVHSQRLRATTPHGAPDHVPVCSHVEGEPMEKINDGTATSASSTWLDKAVPTPRQEMDVDACSRGRLPCNRLRQPLSDQPGVTRASSGPAILRQADDLLVRQTCSARRIFCFAVAPGSIQRRPSGRASAPLASRRPAGNGQAVYQFAEAPPPKVCSTEVNG